MQGKTALATGGTTGVGLAAAQRIAAEGAHVFLTGRNRETVNAAVASIGSGATGIRSDITDFDNLKLARQALKLSRGTRPGDRCVPVILIANMFGLFT